MDIPNYKERYSDDGFNCSASFMRYPLMNNNTLDADKALEEVKLWLRIRYKENQRYLDGVKTSLIVMGEIIYYFINNTILSELYYFDRKPNYSWYNVTKVTITRGTLRSILNVVCAELLATAGGYDASGWSDIELHNKRRNWLRDLKRALEGLMSKGEDDPIVIYDKDTAGPELYVYKEPIRMTDDHDLNRLRLYIKNEVNLRVRQINNRIRTINIYRKKHYKYVWYEIECGKDRAGKKQYTLIFHNELGKAKILVRADSIDELMGIAKGQYERNTRSYIEAYQELDYELEGFDFEVWAVFYNKDIYTRYFEYLQQIEQVKHE